MKSLWVKASLYVGSGAVIGAGLGYASQCSGGTCPLLCLWWRGAIFGAVAGLVICLSGLTQGSNQKGKDPDKPPVLKP